MSECYSAIDHVRLAVFFDAPTTERYMSMFTVYCDASGHPDNTKVLAVAGFVASVDQWLEFERNWKDTLNKFGVTSLHMKNFAHSSGEFSDWKGNEAKRRDFLRQLIANIAVRVRHSFSSAVLLDDWREVNEHYYLEELIKPFALCGRTLVHKVGEWANKWNIEEKQIKYVFEDGDCDKGDFMHRMKQDKKSAPIFLNKDEACAFQAADLLAFENLQAHMGLIEGRVQEFADLRHPLRELSKVPSGKEASDWGVFAKENLEKFCNDVGVPRKRVEHSEAKAAR
jgi:hypothetical protein